jgi:Outer membrane lipoprotein-sorting protein
VLTPSVKAVIAIAIGLLATAAGRAAEPADPQQRARDLVAAAIDLTRGTTSYCELSMVIHRPDWERRSSLVAWTRGRDDALIRFTAPPRDAGNATLKNGPKMWTFTPKLNRVIRLPYSMMAQDWAGSDFSYNDLSRTDILLTDYRLELISEETVDGHVLYRIRATPHDDAPVVWGREELLLRDDYVLQEQTFFDQSLEPLKRLQALAIGELGGRTFATRMRMLTLDKPDQWTEMSYDKASFDIPLDDGLFTVFALKSGRAP